MLHKIKQRRQTIGKCRKFCHHSRHFCSLDHKKIYRLLESLHEKTTSIEATVIKMSSHPKNSGVQSSSIANNASHQESSSEYVRIRMQKLEQIVKQQTQIFEQETFIANEARAKADEATAKADEAKALANEAKTELQQAQQMIDCILKKFQTFEEKFKSPEKRKNTEPPPKEVPRQHRPPPQAANSETLCAPPIQHIPGDHVSHQAGTSDSTAVEAYQGTSYSVNQATGQLTAEQRKRAASLGTHPDLHVDPHTSSSAAPGPFRNIPPHPHYQKVPARRSCPLPIPQCFPNMELYGHPNHGQHPATEGNLFLPPPPDYGQNEQRRGLRLPTQGPYGPQHSHNNGHHYAPPQQPPLTMDMSLYLTQPEATEDGPHDSHVFGGQNQ